jgi:hypothetical protein
MRVQNVVFTLILMCAVAACGSETKTETTQSALTENTAAGPRASSQDLQGTWASACVIDKKRLGIYIKEFLTFDENSIRRDTTSYLDAKCESPFFEQVTLGTDQFSANGEYSETRQSLLVKPLTTSAAGMFSSSHYCGDQTRWNIDEERSITDVHSCGVELVQTISMRARNDHGARKLTAKECETGDASDCTMMTYTLAQ